MKKAEIKRKKGLQKWSSRIFGWVFLIILFIFTTIQVLYWIFEDDIEREIINSLHEIQSGEILVRDMNLSPFYHFPDVSVKLEDVHYFEKRGSERFLEDDPISVLKEFYITIDIFNLFRGVIDISQLTLVDGFINIIVYQDSTINLINAIGEEVNDTLNQEISPAVQIEIDQITVHDLQVTYDNRLSDYKFDFLCKDYINTLSFQDNFIDIKATPDIEIFGITKGKQRYLENTSLKLDLNLKLDTESLSGEIYQGRLIFEGAKLNIEGNLDLKNDGFVDLKLNSLLDDPSLLSIIFEESIIQRNLSNIDSGQIFLKGYVKGKTINNIPESEFTFGVKNLHFALGDTDREIKNLNFDGFFSTGKKDKQPKGILTLSDISADLNDGNLSGNFELTNFDNPHIRLAVDYRSDITGIEQVLKSIDTEILNGYATLTAQLETDLNWNTGRLLNQKGYINASLKDLSFYLASTNELCKQLSVNLQWQNNLLQIDSLNLYTSRSDLLIDGEIQNLVQYVLGLETQLQASVELSSTSLDMNSFLTNKDVGQWILDEHLRGVSGSFIFSANSENLRSFSTLPSGDLTIDNLSLELKHVADIKDLSGQITITPDSLKLYHMRGIIAENNLIFSSTIDNYTDLFENNFINKSTISLNLESDRLSINDFFTYKGENYLPEYFIDNIYEELDFKVILSLPAELDSLDQPVDDFYITVENYSAKDPESDIWLQNISTHVISNDEDLIINDFSGRIAGMFINANLNLIHIYTGDQDMKIEIKVDCDSLNVINVNKLLGEGRAATSFETYVIPLIAVRGEIGHLYYDSLTVDNFKVVINSSAKGQLNIDHADSTWWLSGDNTEVSIRTDTMRIGNWRFPISNVGLRSTDGKVEISPSFEGVFDLAGTGRLLFDLSKKVHHYQFNYSIEGFNIENFLKRNQLENFMSGHMNFAADISIIDDDINSFNGEVSVTGNDLIVHNFDIDKTLEKFERTQNFNLIDLSAFMLAGPAGAAITKGSDYARLLSIDPGDTSIIRSLISNWQIIGGIVKAHDVAFTTNKSRIALKGNINLLKNEFDQFTVAVVDKKGCSIISQSLKGSLSNPELLPMNAAGTILAPVINVFKVITGDNCTPFYTGSLSHPSATE